ncbi:GH15759 [Drosophila grimshawi]|uniref:GH15759 n=2 Tax=Drosophila grimshawi TaxID=7222 RepID=B4IYM4_DROGR|nr:GH15759 [Drosophila grimshawi]
MVLSIFYRQNPAVGDAENAGVEATATGGEEPSSNDVVDLMQQQQVQGQPQGHGPGLGQVQQLEQQMETPRLYQLATSDQPVESGPQRFVEDRIANVDYHTEFTNFINRNAPQGFAPKLHNMLPYLGISFVAWPSYWIWRGIHWQTRRRSERIGLYIHRTFQHAKLMQVVILGIGLLMASSAGGSSESLDVHEVAYAPKSKRSKH